MNKSASDLLSLAHLSTSQSPLSSSISTVNSQTLPNVSISPSNSTTNSSLLFQKPLSTLQTPTVRPGTTSNIHFLNATSSNTVRPIIFHQKTSNNSQQPQLLTVMPAGVRVQQLTPVGRASSAQPTTIVRLMSPATTTIRSGNPGQQQQIIQLNTNKQQHPLVIKAIAAQSSNRSQQQPFILSTNTQQKSATGQGQQQQVLVLNQNSFSNSSGQHPTFTLQMATPTMNPDPPQHEPSSEPAEIPQLDGGVDDQVKILGLTQYTHHSFLFVAITEWYIR